MSSKYTLKRAFQKMQHTHGIHFKLSGISELVKVSLVQAKGLPRNSSSMRQQQQQVLDQSYPKWHSMKTVSTDNLQISQQVQRHEMLIAADLKRHLKCFCKPQNVNCSQIKVSRM
jgi:predicted nuclease of restriction endonuclease-like (RecB) superfamily